MPAPELEGRVHDAVLWPKIGEDDFGDPIIGDPVAVKVRWVFTESEAVAPDGTTVAISARVEIDREVEVGSMMWKGKLADFNDTLKNKMMRVSSYQDSDDIRGMETAYEVGLSYARSKRTP